MMQTLRNYMKHIIIITALAFVATIVFSWGMGGFGGKGHEAERGIIGEVNGHKILYQQFAQNINQELQSVKDEIGENEIPEYRLNAIRQNVWQSMIQNVLFTQEIERLGIHATVEEIRFHVRQNPPEFLRSNEQLMTDGRFDISKYHQALSDPRNQDAFTAPIVHYFASVLPAQKLQQRILTTVRLTDHEVKEYYRMKNDKVKVHFLFFDPAKESLEGISITDDQIIRYYKTNREDFHVGEKRKIGFVVFENRPSRQDTLQTLQDINEIRTLIERGEPFEEMCRDYSEDEGSAPQGGDLGFFSRGTMAPAFEEAAFSAPFGEITGPVLTNFGYHLIKVTARKTENNEEQIRASHLLLKIKPSNETWEAMNRTAEMFHQLAKNRKSVDLKTLAEQEGLAYEETEYFSRGAFIQSLGFASRINFLAFNERKGWISEPVYWQENLLVFRILDIEKAYYRPLEEVRSNIETLLQREKRMELAGESCRSLREQMTVSSDFERLAEDNRLKIHQTDWFTMQDYVTIASRDPVFIGTAFKLGINEISPPVSGERGYYLIKAIDRQITDDAVIEAQMDDLKSQLQQEKMQKVYSAWYNDLVENAKIKDYRDQYF
ncbi:MAG TPA: hypothetical protein ENN03_08575 [bacterium]|nr:hypothetical protein [bacterium]